MTGKAQPCFVVVDVGCIECGEPTKIVGVFANLKVAEKAYHSYLKEVGASGKFEPSSATKLVLRGDELLKNGEIAEQGYFSSGQHSVELHKWQPDTKGR